MRRRWGNAPRAPLAAPGVELRDGRVEGVIAFVSEDRFRVIDRLGRGYLFTLSHRARASTETLDRWAAAGRAVRVIYRGQPDLGAIAERVTPIGDD